MGVSQLSLTGLSQTLSHKLARFGAGKPRLPYAGSGGSGLSLPYEAELLGEADPGTPFSVPGDWLDAGEGDVRIRPLLLDDELDADDDEGGVRIPPLLLDDELDADEGGVRIPPLLLDDELDPEVRATDAEFAAVVLVKERKGRDIVGHPNSSRLGQV